MLFHLGLSRRLLVCLAGMSANVARQAAATEIAYGRLVLLVPSGIAVVIAVVK
jgi:hypothetical protein